MKNFILSDNKPKNRVKHVFTRFLGLFGIFWDFLPFLRKNPIFDHFQNGPKWPISRISPLRPSDPQKMSQKSNSSGGSSFGIHN